MSLDFDKSEFPKRHTCDGEDRSPLVRIDRISTKYLAIIVDDIVSLYEAGPAG
jgi:phosphatidylethanolamine-binding protein (PEBP) family uncharacterized protein